MKRITGKVQIYFFLLSLLTGNTGCFLKYYQTNSVAELTTQKAEALNSPSNTVVLHYLDNIAELNNVKVINDTISGSIQAAGNLPMMYAHPYPNKPNIYKKKHAKQVLSQVHLYIDEPAPAMNRIVYISRNQIKRADWYDMDIKATKKNRTVSIIGFSFIGGILALFGLFILLFALG